MLKHYLKTAIKNLLRFKLFSFINILGLSIGLCISLSIFLFTSKELSYDRHIKDVDRIYIGTYNWGMLNVPVISTYEQQMPEIEAVSLLSPFYIGASDIKFEENQFPVRGLEVDSNFMKVFQHPVVYGDPEKAFQNKNSIVITQSTAQKLFGNTNPIGQEVTRIISRNQKEDPFIVDLVIEDLKSNSSLQFDALYHQPGIRTQKDASEWSFIHYIKLKEGSDYSKVNDAWIKNILPFIGKEDQIEDKDARPELCGLFPLSDVYFKMGGRSNHRAGNLTMVWIYLGVGILILLIACFNFINLNSAIANKRFKEIGVRKTLGATRKSLFLQLTGESIFTCFISFVLSIIMIEVLFRYLSEWMNINYQLDLFGAQIGVLLLMVLGVVLLGVFSGLYPAAIMSAYQPIAVVKGTMAKGKSALFFRRTLIVVQFVISVFLIIFTSTILSQLNYIKSIPLGFKKEQVAFFSMPQTPPSNSEMNPETMLYELEQSPYIEIASFGHSVPGNMGMGWGRDFKEKEYYFKGLPCDDKYLEIMGIEMLKGRKFLPEDSKKKQAVIIINECAEKMLGEENIIGQKIGGNEVIGVCRDFFIENPSKGHTPVMLHAQKGSWKMRNIVMRLNPDNYSAAIDYVNNYITTHYPAETPNVRFLDKSFDQEFRESESLSVTFIFFACLAVFIACLGLFGLSIFMAEQRTRIIALHKIMGAERSDIIRMQIMEYVRLVIISNIISWPLAFYAAIKWLDQLVNATSFHWYIPPIALMISLVISLGTVSYISFKVSRLNPVDTIKHE